MFSCARSRSACERLIMWMSEVIIVVDPRNADRNSLNEIAAALVDAGGCVLEIDETRGVLTVTVAAGLLAMVRAMEGVAYVRPTMTYYRAA